jgi:glycosyltransferase involved in cell wall biosynthesis
LIHNKINLKLLNRKLSRKAIVLYDPFYVFKEEVARCKPKKLKPVSSKEYIIFPSSWHPDEPIEWIVMAWLKNKIDFPLVITGNPKTQRVARIRKIIRKFANNRINFVITGFLPLCDYAQLFKNATAVLSSTTSPIDMQCSIYEALALGKPIIAPLTPAIKSVLSNNAVYYHNFDDLSLKKAINKLFLNITNYKKIIERYSKILEEDIKKTIEALRMY